MPRPETYLLLEHRLAHAREAAEMVRGRQRVDLYTDRKLNLALVRLLEIVGEAASRVSRTEQDRIVGMPWPEIVGLRNRLIHGFDSLDFDILWQDFARSPLPTGPCKAAAEALG